MKFKSTRNDKLFLNASEVIVKGISDEGGLFVPETFPSVKDRLEELSSLSYNELAKEIFSLYLTDFTEEEISNCVERAYGKNKFDGNEPVSIKHLADSTYMAELWHGPTCAFKDVALQILPHFLTTSIAKTSDDKTAVILVATSGDTGKAALEGFKDVKGTEIIVFYPEDGVSNTQKAQMNTQEGGNVFVCAVKGNFDDTQTGVKKIFTNDDIKKSLEQNNMFFSSANSINFGRLLPQLVYYFYSYFDLYKQGVIKSCDEKINIDVPTGNFGNILAAFYSYKMGLPVNKFICASNSNNVLTDFINTGTYDKNRSFYTTASPSMDILVSSNLERLLYLFAGEDSEKLKGWMNDLNTTGKYTVDEETRRELKEKFYGGYCDDSQTQNVIKTTFDNYSYLSDTHTAVGISVYNDYKAETGDNTPTIIASTASPYKFVDSVLASFEKVSTDDEFEKIKELEKLSGTSAPKQILELKDKKSRFDKVIDKDTMPEFVLEQIETI